MSNLNKEAHHWAINKVGLDGDYATVTEAYLAGYEKGYDRATRDVIYKTTRHEKPTRMELLFLRRNYYSMPVKDLAIKLGRTPRTIYYWAAKYGVYKRIRWTEDKITYLREHWNEPLRKQAEHFGVSRAAIKNARHKYFTKCETQ